MQPIRTRGRMQDSRKKTARASCPEPPSHSFVFYFYDLHSFHFSRRSVALRAVGSSFVLGSWKLEMPFRNTAAQGDLKLSIEDHAIVLASVSGGSLTLGLLLSVNTLWHLKERPSIHYVHILPPHHPSFATRQ